MQLVEDFRNAMDRLEVSPGARLLVAVSGGLDSMTLLHLTRAAGYDVAAGHANFKLRGAASDDDEALVERMCAGLKIPFFTRVLEVDKTTENVQLRARELRYDWFFELMDSESYDFLLTAHHQSDRIETFFINLLRGSGIKGLKSIPEKSGSIVRPLLHTEKYELEAYAKKVGFQWNEDVSNASDDYLRNRIRHGIAKDFSDLSEAANVNFGRSMDFLAEADTFFETESRKFIDNLPKKNGVLQIGDSRWDSLFQAKPLHKYVLQKLGFEPGQFDELKGLEKSQSGRFIEGKRFKIYRDRDAFLLEPVGAYPDIQVEIHPDAGRISEPLSLEWQVLTPVNEIGRDPNLAYLNFSKLDFPLILRKWKPGDRFRPLGMKGFKKLSDFLSDLKLSVPEKNNSYVVESGGEICWVVGLRISETFRMHLQSKACFLLKYNGSEA